MKYCPELAYLLLKSMEDYPGPYMPRLYYGLALKDIPASKITRFLESIRSIPRDFGDEWIIDWPESLKALDWYSSLMYEEGHIAVYEVSRNAEGSFLDSRGNDSHGFKPLSYSPKSLTLSGIKALAECKQSQPRIGLIKH